MVNAEPPRSRFFSLPPIAVGTPLVESLDGYICRLAAKHRVRTEVLRERLAEEDDTTGQFKRKPWPRELEATGALASCYTTRLARMTLQPNVDGLGLANLARHVSPASFLVSRNTWCHECLREMLVKGQFYVPQVWRLHCYTHCTRHDRRMLSHCPCCRRSSSAFDGWFAMMGLCPFCQQSLLTQPPDHPISTWTDRVISGELESLCETLGGNFGDPFRPLLEPDVSWVMRESARHGSSSSREAIASSAGMSTVLLARLEHETESNPMLQTLARVCVAAGVSIVGVLRRDFSGFLREPLDIPLQHASVCHSPRSSIDREQVRREVIGRLRRGELTTMSQLQLRFGADHARMTDLLSSKLRDRLKVRYDLRRRKMKDGRFRSLVAKIAATRVLLLAVNRPFDANQVAAMLGRKCATAPNFLAAFLEASRSVD